jgi:hypothetical protein
MAHPAINKLVVEPELASLLDPLTTREREALYSQLEKTGVEDPLRYAWINKEAVLLDGHNRLKWYHEFGRSSFSSPRLVCVKSVRTLTEAKLWMETYQRGRRNQTDKQKARMNGLRLRWQFDLEMEQRDGSCAPEVHAELVRRQAEELENSIRKVQYDEQYSKAIEQVEEADPNAARMIDEGRWKVTQKEVIKMVKGNIPSAIDNLKSGRKWDDNGTDTGSSDDREDRFQKARSTWSVIISKRLPGLMSMIYSLSDMAGNEFPLDEVNQGAEMIRQALVEWEPVSLCDCEDLECGICRGTGWVSRPSSQTS